MYAVQFHPEVTHTDRRRADHPPASRATSANASGLWTPQNIIADAITMVREQVGDGKVVLGLSGGVDSSVVAALLSRAIGDQLTCVFVDHGLLRLGEREEVEKTFGPSNALSLNLIVVDAAAEFLENLRGASDPEDKRKIIGRTFIDVFDREAHKIDGVALLAQGTIYPDVIESAATKFDKAHVIKSHHNVGGLTGAHEAEARRAAARTVQRRSAPGRTRAGPARSDGDAASVSGPGLGVRILGEVRPEYADTLRRADAIFIEELRRADYYDKVSQAFAVFLPVRSVGVVGDARRYAHVIALRAVETTDFMTAGWAQLPYDLIGRVSNRIINEIEGVSRVVYDVSSKPPATIEWE